MKKRSKLDNGKFFTIVLLSSTIIFASFIFLYSKSRKFLYIDESCTIDGCNAEICRDKSDEPVITVCIYKPEYKCYKKASCEVQKDRKCGWTMDKDLESCLKKFR